MSDYHYYSHKINSLCKAISAERGGKKQTRPALNDGSGWYIKSGTLKGMSFVQLRQRNPKMYSGTLEMVPLEEARAIVPGTLVVLAPK